MEIECLMSDIFYGVFFANSIVAITEVEPKPRDCHAKTSLVAQRSDRESPTTWKV